MCLVYKLNFTTGVYHRCYKKQYIQGLVLPTVSGIPWGSWMVSPADE